MQQQLNIFEDSGDVLLRNDLAQALLDGDLDRADAAARALQAQFSADPVLAPAALLIAQLQGWQRLAADSAPAPAQVLAAAQCLDGPVAAAAVSVLGAQAADTWLTGQWHTLAQQAEGIAWQPAQAQAHAAALYLRARAWPEAVAAVARIGAWRRIPQPLLWMAEARWRGEGADAGWPLLAEALWLAPARAGRLLPTLRKRQLDRLVARFEDQLDPAPEDGSGWAWLPAFALIEQPLLAGPLETATPPADAAPGQAFSLLMALLRLERQGRQRELVAHRARLQAVSAPLFAAYMATR